MLHDDSHDGEIAVVSKIYARESLVVYSEGCKVGLEGEKTVVEHAIKVPRNHGADATLGESGDAPGPRIVVGDISILCNATGPA